MIRDDTWWQPWTYSGDHELDTKQRKRILCELEKINTWGLKRWFSLQPYGLLLLTSINPSIYDQGRLRSIKPTDSSWQSSVFAFQSTAKVELKKLFWPNLAEGKDSISDCLLEMSFALIYNRQKLGTASFLDEIPCL